MDGGINAHISCRRESGSTLFLMRKRTRGAFRYLIINAHISCAGIKERKVRKKEREEGDVRIIYTRERTHAVTFIFLKAHGSYLGQRILSNTVRRRMLQYINLSICAHVAIVFLI